jgi:hypothetical protein
MILVHRTTRLRAEQIVEIGPNPRFREPGGQALDNGFSTNLGNGPFLFGTPEDHARGKAKEFPDEGGAVIIVLNVPDEIVQKAINDWFPLSQGLVQFDYGAGFKELIAAWPEVAKSAQIRSVT